MEEAELIYTEGNMPSKITKDEQVIKEVRDSLLQEAIQDFITSVHTLNIPLDELILLVKENYEKELDNRGE